MRRRGCMDWYETQRALERPAGGLLPVPAEAIEEGLGAFTGRGGLRRKDFLAGGVGLMAACVGASGLSPVRMIEAAAAAAADDPKGRTLVLLYLGGGNDGLNTLVPLKDPRYPTLRSRIAIPAAQTLPLKDTDEFGWHPSLAALKRLYDAGKVAVLPAVDYADADQSHFNSAGFWRTGIVGRAPDRTGWLGRTLDAVGSADNPLQGISVTYGLDPVLYAKKAAVAAVYDPSSFGFYIGDVWDEKAYTNLYRDVSHIGGSPALKAAQSAYANAIRVKDGLRPLRVDDEHPLPPVPLEYPDSDLGRSLRGLGRMLGAGFGTRVATLETGGYDTHDDQPNAHAELLKDLAGSLEAFQADLTARGIADRVLTMVWSEFGRRPEDNDSRGTDHGAGGLLLVVGDRANGGIRSEFPGLAKLDEDENLLVTTEFRTVYATLLESWLGVEAARVLPGVDQARVPIIRA